MAQTPARHAASGMEMGRRGGQMDDGSLQSGRNGAVLGAIVGLLLGVTVWDSWLILAIVLSFYGALVGAVGGGVVGALRRR